MTPVITDHTRTLAEAFVWQAHNHAEQHGYPFCPAAAEQAIRDALAGDVA